MNGGLHVRAENEPKGNFNYAVLLWEGLTAGDANKAAAMTYAIDLERFLNEGGPHLLDVIKAA